MLDTRKRRSPIAITLTAVSAAAIVLATVASPAAGKPPEPAPAANPKNVILFIGDGMGPEQVEIGRRVKGSALFIDGIPWGAIGTLDTDSLEGVTDSAAGATALATGHETNNGWLSMIPTEPEPTAVETVLERAEDRGKATGLFSTGDLPDATAGAFAAHVTDRGEDEEVARQMHEQGSEFLLGGRGGGAVAPLEGQPGVTYVRNVSELNAYAAGPGSGPVYGLIGVQTMAYAIDREEEGAVGKHPTIADGTAAAIDVLSDDPDGFFLMVEAGQIDWAGHSRDGAWTAAEVLAFDAAIETAYDWAEGRNDTLIVVTADHETGGLAVNNKTNVAGLRAQTASTEWMWGAIKHGASIDATLATYAGIGNLKAAERQLIAANKEMGIADVLAARFKVSWAWSGSDEGEHTDAPVPIYAWGPRAGDFAGTAYANERVGQLLLSYLP
jgi:alkaline phosphatase